MSRKRKPSRVGPAKPSERPAERTQYKIDEQFQDSEDEFYAGKDEILLDDGPLNKRRKVYEDGGLRSNIPF
jgi:U3 small nucleolar RNA-associated protein 3